MKPTKNVNQGVRTYDKDWLRST